MEFDLRIVGAGRGRILSVSGKKMNTLKLYGFINIITDYDAGHKLQCTTEYDGPSQQTLIPGPGQPRL